MLSLVGVLLMIIGAGMLSAPRLTRALLSLFGVRWREGDYDRIAGWMLLVLGLVIAVLGRLIS